MWVTVVAESLTITADQFTAKDRERFWARVDRSDTSPAACWEWTGQLDPSGYGVFKKQGRQLRAHRAAYALEHGECPGSLVVRHFVCDNPRCVRPAHLRIGTASHNSADMVASGHSARGAANHNATLTAAIVADARRRVRGGETATAVALEYGVGAGTLRRAVTGMNWTHITDPAPVKPRKQRTYTPAERRDILSQVDALRAEGMTQADAAAVVGVEADSLRHWKHSPNLLADVAPAAPVVNISGDLTAEMFDAKDRERFWSHVAKPNDRPHTCWEWQGYRNRSGYGQFRKRGRQFGAHRVSFALRYGTTRAGLLVRHVCDNPRCVRPTHLAIGTASQNSADQVGGNRNHCGEVHYNATITETVVCEARRRVRGGETIRALALEFGVSTNALYPAVRGKSWRCVEESPVPLRQQHRTYTPAERQDYAARGHALVAEGATYRDAARALGVVRTTLHKWLSKYPAEDAEDTTTTEDTTDISPAA